MVSNSLGLLLTYLAYITALLLVPAADDTAVDSSDHVLIMFMLQILSSTKALWYLGGEATHMQQLKSQDTNMAGVPAVHFPHAVWNERYKSRPLAPPSADAMQPSALWIGTLCMVLLHQMHSGWVITANV